MQNLIDQKEFHVALILARLYLLGLTYVCLFLLPMATQLYICTYVHRSHTRLQHTYTYTYTHIHKHMYIHICICNIHTRTYEHTYVHTHTHTYTHTRTHTHKHTHHLDLVMQQWMVKHLFLSIKRKLHVYSHLLGYVYDKITKLCAHQ